ncbi:MAG TPA: site-specific integrase [Burkholderiales bacterium]|nr:site-specific integrase [Burkholderiales bacterium]
MPYRRKDSPVWWVSYTDPSGKRVRRSTETTERKEAEALEAKWNLETFHCKHWGVEPSRTFDELMLAYLKATQQEKRAADRDTTSAKHLKAAFSGRELSGLTVADVRVYIDERRQKGIEPGTINREVGLLSAAINYAQREWGWKIPNPAARRRLREPEGRARWIKKAEAVALIRAASTQYRAAHLPDFIRLALHTGMRRGEMLGLEWSRVDLQAGLIYLEGTHTKSRKRRSIPLNAEAKAALLRRASYRAKNCPDSPWVFCNAEGEQIASVKKSFTSACVRAGINDFRVHDLRHTCAAWLVNAGVALPAVRDLLGHSTVKVTERYAHLAPESLRAAVDALVTKSRSGHVRQFKENAGAAK